MFERLRQSDGLRTDLWGRIYALSLVGIAAPIAYGAVGSSSPVQLLYGFLSLLVAATGFVGVAKPGLLGFERESRVLILLAALGALFVLSRTGL